MTNGTLERERQAEVRASEQRRLRVLVVDDSVVIRGIISRMIEGDEELELVGTARNGLQALEKAEQLRPDVVTLDIEMPEMNGLEALRQLRRTQPTLRIIMCSTLTQRGASATVDSLMLGADDYVTKPENVLPGDGKATDLQGQLIAKIKQFSPMKNHGVSGSRSAPAPVRAASVGHATRTRPQALVIGVSTGGPTALAEVLPAFPADFPLPVLIVQHMPPLFTRLLAERLDSRSRLRVVEASEGLEVQPGTAILAAGGYHMRVSRQNGRLKVVMNQEPLENFCRPSVDVMFRSACETFGGGVLGAMLTGMGQDGLLGSDMLKRAGGYLIAQDAATSVVWGMPGAVIKAGLADEVLGLSEIVPAILRQVAQA